MCCSSDELNVQWKEVAGGDESTSHLSVRVSCFWAPKTMSWSMLHSGASAGERVSERQKHNQFNFGQGRIHFLSLYSFDF